ncbi:MAG: hypothetical protein HFI75_08740 [Lachnospiraceae bacterium]|nr:hypothetical protein [Lachnospiraceae bacterium]
MNNCENRLVKEMIGIILCYGLLLQIVLFFVTPKRLYASFGLWLGIMLAVYMLVYMYRVLQTSLGMEAKTAEKQVRIHSIIRYITVVVVYGIVIFAHLGSPLACFAGILSLKAAAYLQPLYRKLREKNQEKE